MKKPTVRRADLRFGAALRVYRAMRFSVRANTLPRGEIGMKKAPCGAFGVYIPR